MVGGNRCCICNGHGGICIKCYEYDIPNIKKKKKSKSSGYRHIIIGEFDENGALSDIVHVYDVSDRKCAVYNDVADEHLVITF